MSTIKSTNLENMMGLSELIMKDLRNGDDFFDVKSFKIHFEREASFGWYEETSEFPADTILDTMGAYVHYMENPDMFVQAIYRKSMEAGYNSFNIEKDKVYSAVCIMKDGRRVFATINQL